MEREIIKIAKRIEAENHLETRQTFEAQNVILKDLISSIDSDKDITQKIQKTENELKNIEYSIARYQKALLSYIQNHDPKDKIDEMHYVASDAIKSAILDVQNQLYGICRACAGYGQIDTAITAIYDVENQIDSIIEKMRDQEIYIESEYAAQEFEEKKIAHNAKIMNFLASVFKETSTASSDESDF